ncbi:MAG TPA: NAD(P)-dependent alcohol dehydrogenase [Steroidobacteraceae bacterium]|jgi:NADPH:quinone reductase-like Zn-dependent oxidoreductase|nr:NAD(P)-dependent alcohol dehydrogenase [Steroidobacteraceae bacterium]
MRTLLLTCLLVAVATATSAAQPQIPTTTRKVVLEKIDTGGHRWKLIPDAPVPRPSDHQVLLHVRAVSLNRGDLELLDPDSRDLSGRIVASDAAGEVVAVGRHVRGVRVGDRVTSTYFRNWTDGPPNREKMNESLGTSVDGVLGDYIVLDDTSIVPMAAGLTYEEASTLPTAGLTGWMAVAGHRELKKDDVVLVQGTGGVSTFAAQFAAAAGARVIVTSSSDEKLRRARELGAHDGINYRTTPSWSASVLEITGGHGADVVVDVGGKSTLEESMKSLAFWGQLSIVGGLTGYDGQIPAGRLLGKSARAQGIYVGSRADFERMNAFIVKHRLHPVIDRVVPLEQFADALKQMENGNFVGKIVLRL